MRPFLKWPGGKRRAADWIVDEFLGKPLSKNSCRNYVEPFLGSGAVFLRLLGEGYLKGKNVFLSDGAEDLIELWRIVLGRNERPYRDTVASARAWLHVYKNMATDEAASAMFYELRADSPTYRPEIAARLLCLNGACFNGLYRHNRAGDFNVPIGRAFKGGPREYAKINFDALEAVREAALKAQEVDGTTFDVRCQTIEDAHKLFKKVGRTRESLVYLDPPYDGGFVQYLPTGFKDKDQEAVRDFHAWVWAAGGQCYQTNADTLLIRNLYQNHKRDWTCETESISRDSESRGDRTRLMIGGPHG